MEQQSQPWHSLVVLKGHQLPWKSPQVPLLRMTLELVKQVAHVKLLLWDAQGSCEVPRGVTATQQCAHCRAALQHHWIDNAKSHSSVSLPEQPGQSAFCFCLWDPWQIKTRLSVLAEWPHLPAGYRSRGTGLPVLCSNSHPAMLCPPWESFGGNHTFQLDGKEAQRNHSAYSKDQIQLRDKTCKSWFYR